MALEMSRFYFGDDWSNESQYDQHQLEKKPSSARKYLLTCNKGSDEIRYMRRVTRLAEAVYNLQKAPGFQAYRKKIREEDFQSEFGALECAGHLYRPGLNFRFQEPVGKKTEDFDAVIETASKRQMPCEFKTKLEETELTANSFRNALRHLKDQLPRGEPGIAVLKIPEAWTKIAMIRASFEEGINEVVRQSTRIAGVVIIWEEYDFNNVYRPGYWAAITRFNFTRNKWKDYGPDINAVLDLLNAPNPTWMTLDRLAQRFLEANGHVDFAGLAKYVAERNVQNGSK
jgi:hypothetical protein